MTSFKISPVDIEQRKRLDLSPGNTVRVWQKIQEKGKTRLQAFEGLLIARKHGNEPGGTFTIRRTAGGIGVEKIFPLYSPMIDRIEIVKRSKVRRAKLYYIRDKAVKEVRKRMKQLSAIALSKQEERELAPEEEVKEENADEVKEENNNENTSENIPEEIEEVKEKTEEEPKEEDQEVEKTEETKE
ncbi:MAG TPA: 50S ribosomal protein L19 [Candidatus Vogelbacteria bacterium]|nr:50S ribosomal protein L19 [Candidatus Vogelbacteria bacterium]